VKIRVPSLDFKRVVRSRQCRTIQSCDGIVCFNLMGARPLIFATIAEYLSDHCLHRYTRRQNKKSESRCKRVI